MPSNKRYLDLPDNHEFVSLHAQDRSIERYGFMITNRFAKRIIEKIINGDFISSERKTSKRSIVTLIIDERTLKVLYHRRLKTIITVLPIKKGKQKADEHK